MPETKITVIGAGVAGLTTALLLSKNPRYKIIIAAKHMPGDYDIEYASPWAGADYMPVSIEGTESADWDVNTWPFLQDLAQNHPDAGIHFQRAEVYCRKKDVGSPNADRFGSDPWWKYLFPDFQEIPKTRLKPDINNGTSFTTVCINTAIYLPWLVSQCLKAGVVLKRAVFDHIIEASTGADIIINCTGLSSAKLGGVEDQSLVPVRGQIVVVRNDPGGIFSLSGCDQPNESSYIMMRAAGGGTILGGCSQKGNSDSQFDPNLAIRIMKRAIDMCPQLVSEGKGIEDLDIIRNGVGLRPVREGGTRIEKEKIDGTWVVHNYGHGGAGYQSSYGCSQAAVKLVDKIVDGAL